MIRWHTAGSAPLPRPGRDRWLLVVWGGLLAGLAGVLCWVPLFDLLGLEFSLVLGLAVGPAAAWLGVQRESWSGAARRALSLLVLPWLLITANQLRVRNCNYADGLWFFLLYPVAGAVVAAGWGRAARLVCGRPGLALGVVLLLGLGSVGWAGWTFYATPQIVMAGAAYGWWPGSLYDEALGVPALLGWSRLADLAWVALALAVAHNLAAWRARRWSRTLGIPLLLAVAAAGALFSQRTSLGYHQDRASLEAELGGVRRTARVELHYPAQFPASRPAELLEDVTFRLEQLEAFFELPPDPEPMRVYIYASRQQRRRLMGADRTSLAKPWLREVHLVAPAYGDSLVAHELAHVVAGRFAAGPLRLPFHGGLPQLGLIEGAAVAAEWDGGLLTPHGWAAALTRLGLAPKLETLLGPGFYSQAASRSYAVAGSYVRFLIERYGREQFRAAYASGDLVGSYPGALTSIRAEWLEFLAAQPLGPGELEQAHHQFRRPSIFHRVCAREIARAREEAQRLQRGGHHSAALALSTRICQLEPGDPAHLLALLEHQAAAGLPAEARWSGARLLDHPRRSPSLVGQTLERLGDMAWSDEEVDRARRAYQAALELGPGPEQLRALTIKQWATTTGSLAPLWRAYLLEPSQRELALVQLAWHLGSRPSQPGAYLVGRALVQGEEWEAGSRLLLLAAALPPEPGLGSAGQQELELETLRLLGRAEFGARRFQQAATLFDELARRTDRSGWQAQARDWAERSRWSEERGVRNEE